VISSSAACLAITSGSLALYRAVNTPGRLERVIASGSGSWGNVPHGELVPFTHLWTVSRTIATTRPTLRP
jgi:hypothetical protein